MALQERGISTPIQRQRQSWADRQANIDFYLSHRSLSSAEDPITQIPSRASLQALALASASGITTFFILLNSACGGSPGQESRPSGTAVKVSTPVATATGGAPQVDIYGNGASSGNVEVTPTIAPPAAGGAGVTNVAEVGLQTGENLRAKEMMPEGLRKIYDEIVRLNQEGVFKDATTGGPLSEEDLRKAFLKPLEDAALYENENKHLEDFFKYGKISGVLSPLRAQLYATGNDVRIQSVGEKTVLYIKEKFHKFFEQESKSGGFGEFLPSKASN